MNTPTPGSKKLSDKIESFCEDFYPFQIGGILMFLCGVTFGSVTTTIIFIICYFAL